MFASYSSKAYIDKTENFSHKLLDHNLVLCLPSVYVCVHTFMSLSLHIFCLFLLQLFITDNNFVQNLH